MTADTIIFRVHRDCALVKSVDRFWRVIRQNAFWHKELPCGVQKDKYFSFHSLKSPKPQIFGHFNAFPSGTH